MKDSAASLKTEDNVDTLFVLHKVAEKTPVETKEKEDSVGVLFVVCASSQGRREEFGSGNGNR